MCVFGVVLVRIFAHSEWIRRFTLYISLLSPNAGKYRPNQVRIRTILSEKYDPSKIDIKLKIFITWLCQNKKNGFTSGFLVHAKKESHEFNWR